MVGTDKFHAKLVRNILLILTLGLMTACVTAPPFQEMSDARQAIAAAEEAGGKKHSPRLLEYAQDHLDNAKKYIGTHNYRLARSNAVMARQRAVEALEKIQSQNP